MKGLSVLIYTILLLIVYFVENTAFLAISGATRGIPAKIWAATNKLYEDISYENVVVIPKGMRTFIGRCNFPSDQHLTTEEIKMALDGCRLPQNSSATYPGVVCVFYNYYGKPFGSCRGMLYRPVENYFFDGSEAPVRRVLRDPESGEVELVQ